MSTKVYGCSDDLVEIEGDVTGEVPASKGALLIFSDDTLLELKYGKDNKAIWGIDLLQAGSLFAGLTICLDEESDLYSDEALFEDGLEYAYSLTRSGDWEEVA